MGLVIRRVLDSPHGERKYCIQPLDTEEESNIVIGECSISGKVGTGQWSDEIEFDRTSNVQLSDIQKIISSYGESNPLMLWSTTGNYT
mmetsp:Transcript_22305/g.31874  ORF Transcript_22305/g.31874 Transcript_22305/m.31874 type:complete len:88 (-) Transcript_22305:477-740(-)